MKTPFSVLRHCRSLSCTLIAFVASTLLAGCALQERTKPPTNIFLEDRNITEREDRLPFLHSWIDPELPRSYYNKVFFRSVTASRLPSDAWQASKSVFMRSKDEYDREAIALAKHFQKQLTEKVQKFPNGDYSVVSQPEPKALVFDIAITELEFSHPIMRVGTLVAPVPGVDVAMSTISDPHVAFAARVYDGASGKLVATLADRKFPPTRVIDLNKLTVTSSPREITSLWAEIIAEGLNEDRFAKISDRGIFSLLPW